jgi:hypothetical protein
MGIIQSGEEKEQQNAQRSKSFAKNGIAHALVPAVAAPHPRHKNLALTTKKKFHDSTHYARAMRVGGPP